MSYLNSTVMYGNGRNMQTLSEDLLDGAAAAAEYVFGDAGKRRAIYRMTEKGLPAIRIGNRSSRVRRAESET